MSVSRVKLPDRGSNCSSTGITVFQVSQTMTNTDMPMRNQLVPIARAKASEKRPMRSLPEGRNPKAGRMPLGESSRMLSLRRAMRGPPSAGRDGCGAGAHGFGMVIPRGTSPVIGQQVVEDVVDG